MDLTATALPDDINALKAIVLAHALMVQERDARVADLQERLSSRETEIEHLKLMLAKLRRMQFGRKSEKLERQIEQLELRHCQLNEIRQKFSAKSGKYGPKPRRKWNC